MGLGGKGSNCQLRRQGGLVTVAKPVGDRDQHSPRIRNDGVQVTGFPLARQGPSRNAVLDCRGEGRRHAHLDRSHFVMVIEVPLPTSETISNSSINRFEPGSPSPNPREVE